MDGENLELPDASFDVVLCRFGLMYMPDQNRALTEWQRVLRPEGRVVVAVFSTPNKNGWGAVPLDIIRQRAQLPPPLPGQPGPFSLGAEGVLEDRKTPYVRRALKASRSSGFRLRSEWLLLPSVFVLSVSYSALSINSWRICRATNVRLSGMKRQWRCKCSRDQRASRHHANPFSQSASNKIPFRPGGQRVQNEKR
jgi:SAM-dependent methyltransferase